MTEKRPIYNLSRRRVLGGIGAIGLASAGAGLGTSAFFSDEETFEDNLLVAGSFDLKVDYIARYFDGSMGIRADPSSWQVTGSYPDPYGIEPREAFETEQEFRNQFADDDDIEAALVSLDDVKPGDEGCLSFSLHLFDNPGYIWMYAANLVSADNGQTEPESKDVDEVDGEASGELEEELIVSIYYDDNNNCQMDEGESMIFGPGVGGFTDETGDNPATLAKAFEVMSRNNGLVPLDGDRSTPMAYGDGDTAVSRDCFGNLTTQYITMHWRLPVDHANEIQTDSVEFDVGFYAEQCRHNDGAKMAREPLEIVQTEGFGTNSGTFYDLTEDAGYPRDNKTVITFGDPVIFELHTPKPLDDAQGDNWSMTFDTENDDLADFQVLYNGGFAYVEFNGSWGAASMPGDISTTKVDGETYRVEIPRTYFGTEFGFGGQLRYNGEEPGSPGQNFVINLVDGFSWGPGFNGDASAYQDISTL